MREPRRRTSGTWRRSERRAGLRVALGTIVLLAALGLGCGKPHVLVVGLDGANWRALAPLIDAGFLPNLGRIVREGARAELDCVPADPGTACFCPPVWTSMATGTDADHHRIRGFFTRSDARRSEALWNVAARHGARVVTMSWRGAWPPEPEVDVVLTEPGLDLAAETIYDAWNPMDHPGRSSSEPLFQPADVLERLGLLPPAEPGPSVWAIYARDRVAMDSMLRLEAARGYEEPWERRSELSMILVHGPDKVAHLVWGLYQQVMFGPFDEQAYLLSALNWSGPIERPGPTGWGPMAGPYREVDAWLGRLLEVHPYDYVVLVSDHGMTRNPESGLSGHHHNTAVEAHRGIFAVWGPGVRQGAALDVLSVLDVAPTLAYLLDLPVAEDLPGRVVDEAFEEWWLDAKPTDRRTVPSWNP